MNNTFTSATRKEIKREMKARVKENLGRCIGIQLLYFVPYVLLMILLYATIFGKAFALFANGVAPDDYQLMMAVSQGLNTVWIVLFLMLAITGPLQFGMMHFYAGLSRGEEHTGVSLLFHPFTSLRSFWAGIRMAFPLWLRSIIWSIGPTIIYSILLLSVTFVIVPTSAEAAYSAIAVILEIIYTLIMVAVQVKVQSYNAGWLLLVDDESRGAWAASREAAEVFRGKLWKLFVFFLSFIGWYLLIAVIIWGCLLLGSLGAAMLTPGLGIAVFAAVIIAALCLTAVLGGFVTAYMQTSFFRMYEYLKANPEPPVGMTFEPQYSYAPTEPTEAEQRGESAPQDAPAEPVPQEPDEAPSSDEPKE